MRVVLVSGRSAPVTNGKDETNSPTVHRTAVLRFAAQVPGRRNVVGAVL